MSLFLFKKKPDLNRYDSLIGSNLSHEGDISYVGHLKIDGRIKGGVFQGDRSSDQAVVIVGGTGLVEGSMLEGDHVIISGCVFVNKITAKSLVIEAGAKVRCPEIFYQNLTIALTASVTGTLHQIEDIAKES